MVTTPFFVVKIRSVRRWHPSQYLQQTVQSNCTTICWNRRVDGGERPQRDVHTPTLSNSKREMQYLYNIDISTLDKEPVAPLSGTGGQCKIKMMKSTPAEILLFVPQIVSYARIVFYVFAACAALDADPFGTFLTPDEPK